MMNVALPQPPLRELALFAGAGGGILGGILLGWRTVCAVEIDSYCRDVLLARQRDGILQRFPIWDDVRTFDGGPWRGNVDIISGGFPCQDISSAGKRGGIEGPKSGLWAHFARIIDEVKPSHVFIENSPHLRTRGLVRVLKDLAAMGFDARWGVLGAHHVGAPHRRQRMWIVANADNYRQRTLSGDAEMACASQYEGANGAPIAHADGKTIRKQPGRSGRTPRQSAPELRSPNWWPVDIISGVSDGVAHRMDRVRATGNGQVPGVAALAWRRLAHG